MTETTHVHHRHLVHDAPGRHLAGMGSRASTDCGVEHLLATLSGELLVRKFGSLNLFGFVRIDAG
jgi:hypothetical protein